MALKSLFAKISALALAFIATCLSADVCKAASRLEVGELKCEFLVDPLAIDNAAPHFTWKVAGDWNGARPTAYQVLVASDPSKLTERKADLWNTGRTAYPEATNIQYQGKELKSRDYAYWTVRVWDENGKASKWSKPASFGLGLINEEDWAEGAAYIGVEQNEEGSYRAPLLRKTFDYKASKGERVLLYVNSLGYHEAYVNGQPVTQTRFNPAVSQHPKRSLIVTYDVTSLMREGQNDLMIWIGTGWYHERVREVVKGGPYLRAQIDVLSSQGHRSLVWTDATWKAADSGLRNLGRNWTYGERLDRSAQVTDFSTGNLDRLTWEPVRLPEIPAHKVSAQMCEPNVVYKTYKPVAVHKMSDGTFIYDMGHALVGTAQIRLPVVEKGKTITFYYEEFYLNRPEDFRDLEQFADYYIGDGKQEGMFTNRFQYKAFRYLKIKGLTQALDPSAITASAITTGYSGDSSFECSDKDINAIHDMIHKTVKALTLGGDMVDCPHVERLGYGGDGNASTPTFQTMFDVAPLYMNWLTAWADSQKDNGDMPHTAPNPNRAGGGPYWCEFIIVASWQTYLNYGDDRMIKAFYPHMEKWLDYADSNMKDGLLQNWGDTDYRHWFLGDWATPEGIDQKDPRSVGLVANCVMAESYMTMAKIASVLGKTEDQQKYMNKYKSQAALVHKTYFDEQTKMYSTGTQIDMIYPMLVGATPEPCVEDVVAALKGETAGRFKGHLSTGLVGVPVLTQWATREGEADFVYNMLKTRGYPGYLHMLDNGADFTWEHWDGRRSRVHNCFNGIGSWFYQALAGITPDEQHPGYRHIVIRPQPVDGIDWVKASKNTPYGRLVVNWEKKDGRFILDTEIPVGSVATVHLPDGRTMSLESGSYRLVADKVR